MGLQYGVPLEVFVNKFAHSRFEPAGFTKNPDIPIAKSIADYIFRWLGMEFIPGYREANAPQRADVERAEPPPAVARASRSTATAPPPSPTSSTPRPSWAQARRQPLAAPSPPTPLDDGLERAGRQFAHFQSDAPACDNCGALTVRCGTCYRCFNCGNSMGCS